MMVCPLAPLSRQAGPADCHPASRKSASTPKVQRVRAQMNPQSKVGLGREGNNTALDVSDVASDVRWGVCHTGPPQQRHNPPGLVPRAVPFVGG